VRLLWLTPEAPEPGGAGGAIRSYHQLRGLAERGVELVVVAPAYEHQARGASALADIGVELRLVSRLQSKAVDAARAVASSPRLLATAARAPWLGWQAAAFWTRLRSSVSSAFAAGPFDAAVIEHDFAIAWANELPAALPVGLVFHNAYWTYYEGTGGHLAALEARRFRTHVARHGGRLSRGWAVSEPDRAEIREVLPRLAVDVVPNGVDAGRLAQVTGEPEPGRLLFTGTLDYAPNADAVRWFSDEVLPLVRARRPDARLTVVGRNPPADVRALDRDGAVEVTGWVDDLAPYQRAAAVTVAPLRSGGGTKLKVLEALAAGRPLVATPIAAEGIDITDGRHLLVRDDAAGFAEAVVELLDDRDRAGALAAAGRELVAQRYDWSVLADAMHDSLERWLR
jgi:glycosyltransferase involved in cell wall biosynthesis